MKDDIDHYLRIDLNPTEGRKLIFQINHKNNLWYIKHYTDNDLRCEETLNDGDTLSIDYIDGVGEEIVDIIQERPTLKHAGDPIEWDNNNIP